MKTVNETADVGVIVGRFQVPELHEAHKELIKTVVDKHPRVLIFLGLSPCKVTYNNPLDFVARKAMIESSFPDVEVHYVEDTSDDKVWSTNLDKQISKVIGPNLKVVLYGSRDSFIPHYMGRHKVEELVPDRVVCGKEIRRATGIKSKTTSDFRAGVIWAVENQFASVYPTVDIAIVDRSQNRLLLGRKDGETLFRFIGGFADVNSESYEMDAKREVMEETGLEVAELTYIGSTKINDWRYRSERNKIKTLFYCGYYVFGGPQASDDIAEVRWFDFAKLRSEDVVVNHRPLLAMLIEFLNKK